MLADSLKRKLKSSVFFETHRGNIEHNMKVFNFLYIICPSQKDSMKLQIAQLPAVQQFQALP